MNENAFLSDAKAVIDCERDALGRISAGLGDTFVDACRAILNCQGKVIVTGMGKSGHVGGKIAATLASTGTHFSSIQARQAIATLA